MKWRWIYIKENYKIKVTSVSSNEDETIEATYIGRYINRGNEKYIVYREYTEGCPYNYSLCIVKVEGNKSVTLTKNKKYQTKIILENKKRHYSPYYTEYGLLSMSVYTESIENNLFETGGDFNVKYHISINSNFVSSIDITMKVEKLQS